MESTILKSGRIEKLGSFFLFAAAVFMVFLGVNEIRTVFEAKPPVGASISVQGTGSVFAVPDVARISFTVREESDDAETAQGKAAQIVNAVLSLLDDLNIEEKDIKTTSYNVSPEYSRPQPCSNGFCPEYEREIVGYSTTQRVEIKVRNTAQVGEVLTRLGSTGVSNLSGPNFSVDDMEALREEVRELAIKDAREKAKKLANDLGVRLVRVTGFWEEGDGYYPNFRAEAAAFGGDGAVSTVPDVPTGENEIVSRVSLSYEIR